MLRGPTQQSVYFDNGQWKWSFRKTPKSECWTDSVHNRLWGCHARVGKNGYLTFLKMDWWRRQLRDVFKIPVPRILAWSFDAADSPVEAEYIIAEKAPGIKLGSVWSQWTREAKLSLIRQVVDMENTLTTISFPRHGCIYFKDDLQLLAGEAENIYVESSTPQSLDRFSIGPLTFAELWDNGRKDMKLDRGPCE